MLLSGLWKLAAMASVIGVGLVAVYQAQQGMDKTSITASDTAESEPVGDELGDPERTDGGQTTIGEKTDPFNEFGLTANSSDTSGSSNPSALPPPLPEEFESAGTSESPEKVPSGPGVDFRADAHGPATGIEPTATEEAQPARLPDDLDALEVEVLKAQQRAATKSTPTEATSPPPVVKPFVRQVRAANASAATTEPSDNDPFATDAPQSSATGEAGSAEVNEKSAAETDPFEVNSAPPAALVKPAPLEFPDSKSTPKPLKGSDANRDTPAKLAPIAESGFGSPAELQDDVPAKSRTLPLTADETKSPFTPSDVPANTAKPSPVANPTADFPDEAPRRRGVPKLPTEIPDSLDAGFPSAPPAIKQLPALPTDTVPIPSREPLPERRPVPDHSPVPGRLPNLPKPVDDDLLGDGTVERTSPRGVQHARVTIEKVAPQQATLGEPLVYSVIVKNIGNVDATQVIVEDRIPKGTELTGTAPRAEMIDKKLIWRIGTLKPNEEKKISIRVIPRQEGPIGSVARVNFSTEVAAEIQVAAPQLSFQVKAPRQARMGESFELTFLLKNTGTATATNVSVRDLVPVGLKHEAAADIECPIGKLAPGETREIVLAVTAMKPGRATNRAVLSGDGGIGQELESVIDIIGEQLVLTRSGQTKIYVDRPAVFTNNVKNEGNADVNQVRVAEVIPAGLDFVEASDGGRFDPVQRAIFWDLGVLPAGAETAVSSKLVARTAGSQQSKITASGPAGSSAAVKADIDVVGRPELQIETVSRTGAVAVGDRLTTKIQLKNHGSAAARNVSLSIRLPRELKLVEVRGAQYSLRDNTIAFDPVATISPRETAAFEVVMEAISEADAQMNLEISADHLSKPARRSETVQIAAEVRE